MLRAEIHTKQSPVAVGNKTEIGVNNKQLASSRSFTSLQNYPSRITCFFLYSFTRYNFRNRFRNYNRFRICMSSYFAPGPGGSHGEGSRHFLLRKSDASEGVGEAFEGATCCRSTPPEESPATEGVARPIRNEPVSRARCIPGAPLGAVSSCCRGPISGQLSAGVA